MICSETGYNDELVCECLYEEATDTMYMGDCAVHADVDGTPYALPVIMRRAA
jgi:hypothetical protein